MEITYNELNDIELDKLLKYEYRNYQIYTLMDRAIPHL
jgi:DNA gyrase/topoisomerase IV subunit A